MSRAVTELRQIPFEQLIGAPLKAAIEAQALAAQSTIEFIQKIGFKTPAGGFEPDDMIMADTASDANAGELRNVTFRYTKKDETDQPKEFVLTVPLLAITPIPYIRIDEMTIDFSAKLTDAVERNGNLVLANNQLAGALASLGGSEAAFNYEKHADELTPDNPFYHWMIGVRLQNLGMNELAEKHFQRAIQLDPGFQARRKGTAQ